MARSLQRLGVWQRFAAVTKEARWMGVHHMARRLKGKGLTLKQGNLKSLIPGEGGAHLPVAE